MPHKRATLDKPPRVPVILPAQPSADTRDALLSILRFIDSLVHWGFAQVGIPIVSGIIGALMLSLEQYTAAQACFVAAGVWGLLCLWRTRRENISLRDKTVTRLLGTMAMLIIVGWVLSAIYHKKNEVKIAVQHIPTVTEIANELEKRKDHNREASKPESAAIVRQTVPIDKSRQPFGIEIENSALMSDSREWTNGFWVAYNSSHGFTITPVHLALFLRLENEQATNSRIDTVGVEIKSAERWVSLVTLHTGGATVYNAYPDPGHFSVDAALKKASKLDFDEFGLEEQLKNRNGLLKPDEMIRGWAFYEYPAALQHLNGSEQIKVTVTDTRGNTATHIHNRKEEQASRNRTVGQLLKVAPGEFVDLSGMYRKHWDDP